MANYICIDSVEEQVNYLIDKIKDLKTNKLDKTAVVQETGTGTDVVMSQKAVTDAIANKGLDTLTDVNLTLGNTTVQYDTTNGIQLNSTARFTDGAGNHDATMELALPVVGKDGIVIDKAADSEKIEISGENFTPAYSSSLPVLWGGQLICYNNNKYGRCSLGPGTTEYTAVLRDSGGQINLPEIPVNDYNAVCKKYVEDNFVKKVTTATQDARVYGIYADGTNAVFSTSQNVPEIDHIAQYTTGGNIRTNTPIDNLDCANKKYVDDAIANIASTTKYQHNLVLEGTQLGSTFKAFMSIPRSDDTAFGTLDELVSALGDAYISCTGYIYDGNQKSYNVVAFNTAGPGFEYNDPETGGAVFAVTNDSVTVTDNTIQF